MQKINKKEDVEEVIRMLVSKRDSQFAQRVKLLNYVLKTVQKMENAFLKKVWESNEYQELFRMSSLSEDPEVQI